MKLTDLFIKRPVLAIVVNLVVLIAGLQAFIFATLTAIYLGDAVSEGH